MAGKDVVFDIELISVTEGEAGFAAFGEMDDDFEDDFSEGDDYDFDDGYSINEY
jgi:hypothetical protein